jgi:GNAT superfamily N-acetyltransferase
MKPDSFQIRHMKSEDLEAVTLLAVQLGYPNTVQDMKARFKRIEALPGYGLFVAKSAEGAVIGWAQINQEAEAILNEAKAELTALVVDEKYRGQGIGSALLKRAEEWAKGNGLALIRLRSSNHREGAHRFYLREGYEQTGQTFKKRIELKS